MVCALLLVLAAIGWLGGMYLVRAALVEVGGFALGGPAAVRQLRRLVAKPRYGLEGL